MKERRVTARGQHPSDPPRLHDSDRRWRGMTRRGSIASHDANGNSESTHGRNDSSVPPNGPSRTHRPRRRDCHRARGTSGRSGAGESSRANFELFGRLLSSWANLAPSSLFLTILPWWYWHTSLVGPTAEKSVADFRRKNYETDQEVWQSGGIARYSFCLEQENFPATPWP